MFACRSHRGIIIGSARSTDGRRRYSRGPLHLVVGIAGRVGDGRLGWVRHPLVAADDELVLACDYKDKAIGWMG